jgi:hypothetical protein
MKTAAMMVLSLGLFMAPCTFAQSDTDKTKDGNPSSGQHKTIHGVVAGVTVLGETMVDYESGRAIAAERDYLTVVDADHHDKGGGDQASHGEQASGGDKKSEGKQDKDVKQTAGAGEGSNEKSGSDQASKRSARVYLVEVTPETEVCECQKDGKKKCELARLEIGDHVEIEFQPSSGNQSQNQGGNMKHGRHRMMRGQAISISILQDQGDHGKSSGSSPEHSKDGNKGEQK